MPEPTEQQDGPKTARKTSTAASEATPSPAPQPVAAPDTDAARYEPYPGPGFFHGGRYSPIIAAAGARLTREGHNPPGKTLGPDWTTAHRDAWSSFQKTLRPKESGDVSGIPDEIAWDALKVPRVSPLPKQEP
ncbi:hypothetical protein ACWDPF_27425 [Streptomyces albogriseolus]